MTRRDAQIAKWSRLYRLLADRPEYASHDQEQRFAAATRGLQCGLSGIDAGAIEDATEIDRLCGGAVRLLSRGCSAAVLDVLGWLDPDRLAAIALALPEKRRTRVLNGDPVWARAFAAIDLEAIAEVEALIADFDRAGDKIDAALREFGFDVEGFNENARRHLLGLDSDLSYEERLLVENPRAFSEAAAR